MNFKSFLEQSSKLQNNNNMDFKKFLNHKHPEEKKTIEKILPELQIIDENQKKIKKSKKNKCLVFDSRHRNKIIFPNTNKFTVSFNPDSKQLNNETVEELKTRQGAVIRNPMQNIIEIKITQVILPTIALNYPYIQLKIDEINSKNISVTNGRINDVYAILIPDKTATPSGFVNCVIEDGELSEPIANLQKLSISFYDPDDILINFGADNIGSIKSSVQTTILCKITYLDNNINGKF
jgi:hypothetical protein